MIAFDRHKRIVRTVSLPLIAALALACVTLLSKSAMPETEALRGERPFDLVPAQVSTLGAEAEKGDCAAAHRLAQYHLYASLELPQAEKYFRLATRCKHADAFAGLITVLRRPEDDAELDDLIVSLKKIDAKTGESAAVEVALRRAERTSGAGRYGYKPHP